MTRDLFKSFEPHDIDEKQWDERKENDRAEFLRNTREIFSENVVDTLGILGSHLDFSLSISNSGAVNDYRLSKVRTGEEVRKEVLNALCLELEDYVSIVNWIPENNQKREELYRSLERFISDKESPFLYKILGNYRLSKNSFSSVLLYRAETFCSQKEDKSYFDWWRIPFLKKSGEDFAYFSSPAFMSKLISEKESVSEENINKFCAPFKVLKLMRNFVEIGIYSNTIKYGSKIIVGLDNELMKSLLVNEIYLGLFEEKIYRKDKGYRRNYFLTSVNEETYEEEILGHFILQRLYYNYLKNRNVEICSIEELKKYFMRCLKKVEKIYDKRIDLSFDYFKLEFLESFFRIIQNKLYYSPFILKNLHNEEFKRILRFIKKENQESKNILDKLENMKNKDKYSRYEKLVKFINSYNFYKNRTLIEKHLNSESSYIEREIDNPEKWKWKIQ